MSQKRPINLAASVADRLLQRTRKTGEDHQLLLTRYGLERLMYRLSMSEAADRFIRRKTPLPADAPVGLTDEFSDNLQKHSQWDAFLRRTHAKAPLNVDLSTIIKEVRGFLLPPLLCAGKPKPFNQKWSKGGPWHA